jgi:hypothetical protein
MASTVEKGPTWEALEALSNACDIPGGATGRALGTKACHPHLQHPMFLYSQGEGAYHI